MIDIGCTYLYRQLNCIVLVTKQNPSQRVVLYADDDADDRLLLSSTFQTVAPDVKFETVPNGFKALDYLEERKEKLPCLLILDLNMPGMSGKEVMHRVKSVSEFESLPIVVFTTSSNPADKAECARYGVDMITKPIDLKELNHTASKLLSYCR